MNVLVACEFSGIVRDAFIDAGHTAVSCDILPSESNRGEHWQCDIRHIDPWDLTDFDLMVAHPPCTYLANSGVRWLYTQDGRWQKLDEGAEFFRAIDKFPIPHIAIENPIPHKHAVERIGRHHDQVIQPWQFGHGETKAVCLWLRGLPPLEPVDIVDGREARVHRMSPSADRQKERSRFFPGIARAMAEQWGCMA